MKKRGKNSFEVEENVSVGGLQCRENKYQEEA